MFISARNIKKNNQKSKFSTETDKAGPDKMKRTDPKVQINEKRFLGHTGKA